MQGGVKIQKTSLYLSNELSVNCLGDYLFGVGCGRYICAAVAYNTFIAVDCLLVDSFFSETLSLVVISSPIGRIYSFVYGTSGSASTCQGLVFGNDVGGHAVLYIRTLPRIPLVADSLGVHCNCGHRSYIVLSNVEKIKKAPSKEPFFVECINVILMHVYGQPRVRESFSNASSGA